MHDETVSSTGIAGFDEVLCGGLPRNRFYLVEGFPGTGKTTLGIRFLLEGVARGERGLYVTLSETAAELDAIAASHGLSLAGVDIFELQPEEEQLNPDDQYTIAHPAEIELGETTKRILDEVERTQPARVVLDSLSELRLLARDPLRYRREILLLKQFFSRRQATVILLDDRTGEDADGQLQSISHGVVRLESTPSEFGRDRRRLRILKLRGRQYAEGYHDFNIVPGGLCVFPRVLPGDVEVAPDSGLAQSGVPELDALLGGGLHFGTSTLLIGPAGVGKSIVASQYAHEAAEHGRCAAIYLFDESLHTFITRSTGIGFDPRPHVAAGRIIVDDVNLRQISPGEFVSRVIRDVEERGARVVVIDSINGYVHGLAPEGSVIVQLHEMLAHLGRRNVLTLMIVAQHGIVGGAMHAPIDVSYLADSVIMLRFFEAAGAVRRAISVVKKRTGKHEPTIREMSVDATGMHVGPALRDFQGVLTGVPSFVGASSNLRGDGGKR